MLIGVDYDTNDIYLCAYEPDETPVLVTCALRTRRNSDLMEAIGNVPTALAIGLQRIRLQTDITDATMWVERGRGPNRNADWALGAIAGAIISAYPRINRGAARLMDANQWKAAIGTRGNTKAAANLAATLQWRSRHPATNPPTNPNQLDAYGIAIAAHAR